MDRTLFLWNVQLADEHSNVVETTFASYWSPERDYVTSESIALAAAAQETVTQGRKLRPIAATQVLA